MIGSAINRGVARIALTDALAWGEGKWDDVVASSPMPSPFMRWGWHDAWAQSAPADEVDSSFTVTVHGSDGSLEAFLPLGISAITFRRARVTALTWATRGLGCPDHLDIPAPGGTRMEDIVALLERLPWDLVLLSGVAEGAANVSALVDAFGRRRYRARWTVLDSCPYLDLPTSWDAYLNGLSASRRQAIRRRERKLSREHAVTVTDYGVDRWEEGWSHLISLHEQRWGGPGALGIPALSRLLRRYTSVLASRGELWLTTLDIDGEPVAAWCGFTSGDTVYFYQSGRAPKWESDSVGHVLMGIMIRRAIEAGYRRFDFLRGRDPYKLSWTSTERLIYDVVIFRRGWRGLWLRALDYVGRVRARLRSRATAAASLH